MTGAILPEWVLLSPELNFKMLTLAFPFTVTPTLNLAETNL